MPGETRPCALGRRALVLALALITSSVVAARPAAPDLPSPRITCLFNGDHDSKACASSEARRSSLEAWLQPETAWTQALTCTEDAPGPVLDSVPYGSSGAFAISVWFKAEPSVDGTIPAESQFIFSHAKEHDKASLSRRLTPDLHPHIKNHALYPSIHISETNGGRQRAYISDNQVQIFLPGHPASGVVRTLVRDSEDADQDASFLDSDGIINNFDGIRDDPEQQQVMPGEWHHLVLTTHGESAPKGYQLYLDGRPAPRPVRDDPTGAWNPITGGRSLDLGGSPIYLCQGADGDPKSRFRGHLSHLRVFDTSLTHDHVRALLAADASAMTSAGRRRLAARSLLPFASGDMSSQSAPGTTSAATPGMTSAAVAGPGSAGGPSSVYTLLNGEAVQGVSTANGLWASMGSTPAISNVPNSYNPITILACDGSQKSMLPLPLIASQPLSVTGFSVSMWLRLPALSQLPGATAAPIPIFAIATTHQLRITQPDAAIPPRRRLQQDTNYTTAPVVVPMSLHGYLLRGNELHVVVEVAIVAGAAARLAAGQPLVSTVQAYHAQVNMLQTQDGALHHLAVVATPPAQQVTGSGLGYNVFVDGQQQAVAVLAAQNTAGLSGSANGRRKLRASPPPAAASVSSVLIPGWLMSRTNNYLQAAAENGHAGVLLLCGAATAGSNTTATTTAATPGGRRRGLVGVGSHIHTTTADTIAGTMGRLLQQQSSPTAPTTERTRVTRKPQPTQPATPAANPAPSAPAPLVQLNLLTPAQTRQAALMTDLRVFADPLLDSSVRTLWTWGPGYQAADVSADPGSGVVNTTTSDSASSLWVQSGSGFVPRGSTLDPSSGNPSGSAAVDMGEHPMGTVLPEDVANGNTGGGDMGLTGGSDHAVNVVLPEDRAADSARPPTAVIVTPVVEASSNKGQSVRLGVGLGVGLGVLSIIAALALFAIVRRRQHERERAVCIQLQSSAGAREVGLLSAGDSIGGASNPAHMTPRQSSTGAHSAPTSPSSYVKMSCAPFKATGSALKKHLASLLPTTPIKTDSPRAGARGGAGPFVTVDVSGDQSPCDDDDVPLPTPTTRDVLAVRNNSSDAVPIPAAEGSRASSLTLPDLPTAYLPGFPGARGGSQASSVMSAAALGITSPRMRSTSISLAVAPAAVQLGAGSSPSLRRNVTSSSVSKSSLPLLTPNNSESDKPFVGCFGRVMSPRTVSMNKPPGIRSDGEKSMILMPNALTGPMNPSLMRTAVGGADSLTPMATGSRAVTPSMTAPVGVDLRGGLAAYSTSPTMAPGLAVPPLPISRASFSGPGLPAGTAAAVAAEAAGGIAGSPAGVANKGARPATGLGTLWARHPAGAAGSSAGAQEPRPSKIHKVSPRKSNLGRVTRPTGAHGDKVHADPSLHND